MMGKSDVGEMPAGRKMAAGKKGMSHEGRVHDRGWPHLDLKAGHEFKE